MNTHDLPLTDPSTRLLLVDELGDAFSRLYDRYQKVVYKYLAHRNGIRCDQDLEDMVQEVFLRAWRGRKDFRGDSSVKTYLLAIAKNVQRETWRENAKHRLPDSSHWELTEQTSIENCIDVKECASTIIDAISKLSPRHRNVAKLVLIEGRLTSDAARISKCSPNAIRHRLGAALQHLRNSLSLCSAAKCPHSVGSPPNDCSADCFGLFCAKNRILRILDKSEKSLKKFPRAS